LTGPKLRALAFLAAATDQTNRSNRRKFKGLDIWLHAAKRRLHPVAKGLRSNRIMFGGEALDRTKDVATGDLQIWSPTQSRTPY
jgi:hypothetical protein